ncbi:MAG: beta-ketoacyl-ACP synthase 3 [Propionibacteriaceae bacterium]|nr:beta-ketoacyl-ACP synthase 3 [Propionibacteriaceae bacterium]
MTLSIAGTGLSLPSRRVSNDELAQITGIETTDEWIQTMTGISSRYMITTETLVELAEKAAVDALADAQIDPSDVDYIIAATMGCETSTPSLACHIAEHIGVQCPAVDLNAACVGFLYALDYAAGLIQRGRASTILIITGERMSAHIDWTDRRTCILFGDGAAGVVATAGSGLTYLNLQTRPDTEVIYQYRRMCGNSPLATPDEETPMHLEGQKVFKYAVSLMEQEITTALETLNLQAEDIDHYLIHQANRRIIDFAIERLGLSPEKFPMNIDQYGNMSAVSIPALLHEMRQNNTIQPGDTLLLCAFGAGMTCGSSVIRWETPTR